VWIHNGKISFIFASKQLQLLLMLNSVTILELGIVKRQRIFDVDAPD